MVMEGKGEQLLVFMTAVTTPLLTPPPATPTLVGGAEVLVGRV